MRAAPPLALSLLLSLAVLSGAAEDAQDPPDAPPKLELKAPAKAPDVPEEKPVKVSEDLAKRIKELGFNFDKTGQLVHPETGTTISKQMLESAGLTLDEEGRLVYKDQPKMEVEQRHLQGVLSSLLKFGKVAAHDPRAAGRTLQAWGIPPAYDGIHLLNPDGTATYFGLMLYEGLRKDPTGQAAQRRTPVESVVPVRSRTRSRVRRESSRSRNGRYRPGVESSQLGYDAAG